MNRAQFIKIIKMRSIWKIDKRRGDYMTLVGKKLSDHISYLVETQLAIDFLAIAGDGDPRKCSLTDEGFIIYLSGGEQESCSQEEQEKRLAALVNEIIT